MRIINEAYDGLGNKGKRRIYDYIFFGYGTVYEQDGSVYTEDEKLLRMPWWGRYRYFFANFAVLITGLKDSLDLVLISLAIFASALYIVFGMGKLAAIVIAIMLISAGVLLMVRVLVEVFNRVGIRREEPWIDEIVIAHNNSLERTSDSASNGRND